MSKTVMLDAALSYVSRGWCVFPAKFDGKTKRGCTSAAMSNGNNWGHTRDAQEIRNYWRRWPRAAIGLPTGSVNGFFVVDVDTKEGHGKDGVASLQQLEMQHGDTLRFTRQAISPTGSVHYYFRLPPGAIVPNSTGRLAPGVDVRGEGGFVVAPPSVRPGHEEPYRWAETIGTHRVADAPPWLLNLVVERRGLAPAPSPEIDAASCDPAMLAAMAADAGRGISTNETDDAPVEDVRLKLQAALAHISADVEYGDWFRVACALHGALGDDGFSLFDEWSSDSAAKYEGTEACARKWRECAKVKAIGPQTVYWLADQYDPSWRNWYQRLVAAGVRP